VSSTTRVREVRKEAARASYEPRLKVLYEQELRPRLKEELEASSLMDVPRIEKITLNMGVGEAKTDAKQLDSALDELTTIAGQRAQVRRARKSIAQFKIREGMPIGAKVTLRGARMYEFLDRAAAHPRLPRPQPARVRRPRQLLARHSRADHLPRDQLRRHPASPRPRRRDYHLREDGRAGAGALARPRHAVRGGRKGAVAPHGQDLTSHQAIPPGAVQGAQLLALQPLRTPARRLPQVRPLPDLPAGPRAPGRHPGHDQEQLVT